MDKAEFEEKVFELISYMVVSARNLLDEPKRYATFRLLDAAGRMVKIMESQELASTRLTSIRGRIEQGMSTMVDDDVYCQFLEDLVLGLVEEME